MRAEARYRDKLTAMPWGGRFWEYSVRNGMLIPLAGEVGWEYPEGTRLYFKGRTTEIHYEFASRSTLTDSFPTTGIVNKRKFIGIAGGTIIATGITAYLLSDRSNFSRADLEPITDNNKTFQPDEKEILFLASLAPSGHNTQPWFVRYLAPYHWIVGNDRSKWLPAVDPTQRETMLSLA